MWGGARKGAGRKPGVHIKPEDEKAVTKAICLSATEWEQLAKQAHDGSPNKEAARIIRQSLAHEPTHE